MLSKQENKLLTILIECGFCDTANKKFNIPKNYGWKEFWEDYYGWYEGIEVSDTKLYNIANAQFAVLRSAICKISFLKSQYKVLTSKTVNIMGHKTKINVPTILTGQEIADRCFSGLNMTQIKEFISKLNCVFKAYDLDDNHFLPPRATLRVNNEKNKRYLERMSKEETFVIKPQEIQLWIKKDNEWLHWDTFINMNDCQKEIRDIRKHNPHWEYNVGGPKEEVVTKVVTTKQKEKKIDIFDLM